MPPTLYDRAFVPPTPIRHRSWRCRYCQVEFKTTADISCHDVRRCREQHNSTDTMGNGVKATEVAIRHRVHKYLPPLSDTKASAAPTSSTSLITVGAVPCSTAAATQTKAGLDLIKCIQKMGSECGEEGLDLACLDSIRMAKCLRLLSKCPSWFVELGTGAVAQLQYIQSNPDDVRERLEDPTGHAAQKMKASLSQPPPPSLGAASTFSITTSLGPATRAYTKEEDEVVINDALHTIQKYLEGQLRTRDSLVVRAVGDRLYSGPDGRGVKHFDAKVRAAAMQEIRPNHMPNVDRARNGRSTSFVYINGMAFKRSEVGGSERATESAASPRDEVPKKD